MRENRTSGSEGGGAEPNRSFLPLCAPVSVMVQRGESPLRASTLRPVMESNCASVRRGGEQLDMNKQSVGNELDSAVAVWRACLPVVKPRKACRAEGLCVKATAGGGSKVVGDGMLVTGHHVKQGDLSDNQDGVHASTAHTSQGCRRAGRSGVRASIVARKPGNAGGAKGRRKMDV